MKCHPSKEAVTNDTVKYVANLSRLSFNDEELARFKGQLSAILGYIEQLREVDTEGVTPTTHVLPSMKNVFREDETGPSLSPEAALRNAPDKEGDMFRVPRVIG